MSFPMGNIVLWAYEGISLVDALLLTPNLPLGVERDVVSLRYELRNLIDNLSKTNRFNEAVTVSYAQ